MIDPATLQIISTAAIVLFGSAQLIFAFWVAFREWRSSSDAHQFRESATVIAQEIHTSTIATVKEIHTSTMATLGERRKDAERQHQEVMAAFKERQQDAKQQHQETMAAFDIQRQAALAATISVSQETARGMVEKLQMEPSFRQNQ